MKERKRKKKKEIISLLSIILKKIKKFARHSLQFTVKISIDCQIIIILLICYMINMNIYENDYYYKMIYIEIIYIYII